MSILVSCVIPTHNRPRLAAEAVESVLNDHVEEIEVVVVDDGSEARNFEVLSRKIGEVPRVRLLRNSRPLGASNARNVGILEALGKFVTFVDDDDVNIPGRIKSQLDLAVEANADFVTCTRFIYETKRGCRVRGIKADKVSIDDMWLRNIIVSVTPLVRWDLMRAVMFDEGLPAANDYDAWIRCLQLCTRTVNYSGLAIRHRRKERVTITKSRNKKLQGRLAFYRKHRVIMPLQVRPYFLLVTMLKWVIPDPRFVLDSAEGVLGGRLLRRQR